MNALVEAGAVCPHRRASDVPPVAAFVPWGEHDDPARQHLPPLTTGAMVYFHGDPRSTGARFVWRAGSGRRARHAPGTTATPPRSRRS